MSEEGKRKGREQIQEARVKKFGKEFELLNHFTTPFVSMY